MALKNWKSVIALRLIMLTTASLDHMYYRLREKPSDKDELVIYFGGDIQDFRELMKNDSKKKHYLDWSFDNTSEILSNKFPHSDVLVVAPSRYDNNSFSYYDKYVDCEDMGIPSFTPYHGALIHLDKLLYDLADLRTAWDKGNKTDFTKYRFRLIGFSKGCVVLNQFLYEFHYGPETTKDPVLRRMISQIDAMYFLDGGHAGKEETWITEESLLETLMKLGIEVYVHVTPYQVRDKRRPWIGKQEELFTNTLKNFGAKIYRKLHFENDPPSLQKHFEVLKAF